jgi:hypothetical protein
MTTAVLNSEHLLRDLRMHTSIRLSDLCRFLAPDESRQLPLFCLFDGWLAKYNGMKVGVQHHARMPPIAGNSQKFGVRLLEVDVVLELNRFSICKPVVDWNWREIFSRSIDRLILAVIEFVIVVLGKSRSIDSQVSIVVDVSTKGTMLCASPVAVEQDKGDMLCSVLGRGFEILYLAENILHILRHHFLAYSAVYFPGYLCRFQAYWRCCHNIE